MFRTLLTVVLLNSLLSAQAVFNNFDELAAFASQNSYYIKSAVISKIISEKEYNASRGKLLPQLNFGVSVIDNTELQTTYIPAELFGGTKGSYIETQLGQKYNNTLTLSASLDLFNPVLWKETAGSGLAVKLNEKNIDAESYNLNNSLAGIYYNTIAGKDILREINKSKQLQDSLLVVAESRLEEGAISQYEYNKVKINCYTISDLSIQNMQQYREGLRELSLYAGISDPESLVLNESFNKTGDYMPVDLLPQQMNNNPSLSLAEIKMKIAANKVEQRLTMFLPTLSFIGSIGYQQNSQVFSPFGSQDWNNSGYIGLNLSLPVFTGFSRRNLLKSSEMEYELAKHEYEFEKQSAEKENLDKLSGYEASLASVNSQYKSLQLSSENLEIIKNRFAEGIAGIDQYSTAINEYVNNFNQYLIKTAEYYVSKIKIEQTLSK